MCVLEHDRGRNAIDISKLEFNDIGLNDPSKQSKPVGLAGESSPASEIDRSRLAEPTLDELKQFCSLKEAEAISALDSKFGGADNLAASLKSSLQIGLDDADKDDLKRRENKYGKNEIPTAKSESFFTLIVRAFRDPTLVMLTLCALVSIGLSFYKTDDLVEISDDGPISNDTSLSTTTAGVQHYSSSESSIQWIEGVY